MKRTEKDLHISSFHLNFAAKCKKTAHKCCNFHPPENLQNSKYKGEKSESCFSCSSIYTALSCVEVARIYPCRCELISFLLIRVLQNLLAKDARRLTLFAHN